MCAGQYEEQVSIDGVYLFYAPIYKRACLPTYLPIYGYLPTYLPTYGYLRLPTYLPTSFSILPVI